MALKYPKLIALGLSFVFIYYLFQGTELDWLKPVIVGFGYLGTFIAGMLFAYGFTAALATAMFIILGQTQNILIAGLIGGLGAMLSDILIFKFIRMSFKEELERLAGEKLVARAHQMLPHRIKKHVMPFVGAVIIASPLPDEIGVTITAASGLDDKLFMRMSFLLNTAGIYLVLAIGSLIAQPL